MGSFRRNRSEFGKDFESSALHQEASSVTFKPYTNSEILQLSACHVFSPNSFNQLGHPIPNGLYDLKMGPFTDRGDLKCATCLLISSMCPGHVGHIELPLPVCSPLFYSTILRLLKMSCMTCHKFSVPPHWRQLYLVQQALLDHGNIIAAEKAREFVTLPSAQDLSSMGDDDDSKGKRKSKEIDAFDIQKIKERLITFFNEELLNSTNSSDVCLRNEASHQENEISEETKSTRNVESLRKLYNKEFLSLHAKSSTCSHCGAVTKSIVFYKSRFIYEGNKLGENGDLNDSQNVSMSMSVRKRGKGQVGEREKTELTPQEIKEHFRHLWNTDQELLSSLYPMLKEEKEKSSNNGRNNIFFDRDMNDANISECPTDIFFVEVLAVPPPNTRPCQYTGGSMTIHPQSASLTRLLETISVLKDLLQVVRQDVDLETLKQETRVMIKGLKGETVTGKMDTIWKELQADVDRVLDREMNTNKNNAKSGWGFKQLIEKKQGLFRMHMMGKRVNFAARTVITPDPNIAIDEIGLPDVFAKKLSYRVPVTPNNVEWLRTLVMNGPNVHPGAVYVESGGNKTPISGESQTQREALAKTLLTPASSKETDGFSHSNQGVDPSNSMKYVWRHLINGDAMLLNRQPTLHKPSIMAHRARVLKGEKVMRLHYAICKSYNADFDGDEMNAHFPQNELARSEAYNIVNVCKQYLVPKDGTPLQGLIQDHVIAGVKMTIRGRFFSKAQYQQHVFSALVDFPGKIKTLPPSIIKPQQLWSGKQIISTIIINLVPEGKNPPTLKSSAKVKSNEWEKIRPRPWLSGNPPSSREASLSESEVVFRNGEFLAGVLDKNQFGATQYSLTHAFFELYGGDFSGKLLSALSKVFTNFLHTEGFTLGVKDILVTHGGNEERKSVMTETSAKGDFCAANAVGLDAKLPESYTKQTLEHKLEEAHRAGIKNPSRRAEVDRHYKDVLSKATNQINKACLPKGLIKTFPENNLQLMVQAGAKGSTVNTMQISCLLGQIELEGKRPPLMISGKSLPSFKPYDTRPIAGGFIDSRFMTGIKPQEFFFHCMAGREGLIDTAVKTSRSGYLQRCLIKLLEGVVVNYDGTVRDSDGSVVQFQYGEDSMDVCKSQYLKKGLPLDFLADNLNTIRCKEDIERAENYSSPRAELVRKHKRKVYRWKRKANSKVSPSNGRLRLGGSPKDPSQYPKTPIDRLKRDEEKTKLSSKCPDPVVSLYRPESNFKSVTEHVEDMICDYMKNDNSRVNQEWNFEIKSKDKKGEVVKRKEELIDTLYMKVMQAQVEPGEPVGVLAAQSVGEPSTQMTLNTFHFAGRGEMNVTLGIPRLREILMVASTNIKTPSLTIPFHKNISLEQKEAVKVKMNRCSIADVLEFVQVDEKLKARGDRARQLTMRFEFQKSRNYKEQYCVNEHDVLRYFETRYISRGFLPLLSAAMKDKKLIVETGSDKIKGRSAGNEDEDGTNINDENDRKMEQIDRKGTGEGHESSDDEELADDADATDARKKLRQNDEDFEEGLSDDEVDLQKAIKIDDQDILHGDIADDEDDTRMSWAVQTDADDGFEDDTELTFLEKPKTVREVEKENMRNVEAKKRQNAVLGLLQGKGGLVSILDYTYDTQKERWCELTLSFDVSRKTVDMSNVVRKSAEKAVLHEVKNIRRGFIVQNEKNEDCLQTEGVNIDAIFKYENVLDLNRLYCNNVHDMARYYGIEAANKTIVKEIVNVFKAYGIDVDKRHLSLVADYMTFDGTYKPFNRIGIENNPSPLQQMTFETAIGFLRSATLAGKCDTLDSPSSRLVIGKPCNGGTGTFKVMQKLLSNSIQDRNLIHA